MALDIRIAGTKLEYRNSSNGVISLEGKDVGNGGTAGSIRINTTANLIEYVDRSGSLVKRQLAREHVGTTELGTPRSLYISGSDLRYIAEGETPFDIYKVVEPIQAPSAQPANLSVSFPSDGDVLSPFPWDAKATWNNQTNNGNNIRVRWYRNLVLVQNASISALSTSHIASSNYWSNGDSIKCEVYYENSAGPGPVTSWSGTVSGV